MPSVDGRILTYLQSIGSNGGVAWINSTFLYVAWCKRFEADDIPEKRYAIFYSQTVAPSWHSLPSGSKKLAQGENESSRCYEKAK